jgi:hypothetical protein
MASPDAVPQDVRHGDAVARLEAHHLGIDEVRWIDLGIERRRQLHRCGGRPELEDVQIVGRAIAVQIERQLRLAARDRHAADAAVGNRRQRHRLAGGGVDDADHGAAIAVDAGDAIAAAA